MSSSPESHIKAILTLEEGKRLKPYYCTAGKLTIGIGRNLDANGISSEEADILFWNDYRKAERLARRLFPNFDGWPLARQVCVCQMIFQFGEGRFSGYLNTIEVIRNEEWEKLDALWRNSPWAIWQTPKRAKRVLYGLTTGELHADYLSVISGT